MIALALPVVVVAVAAVFVFALSRLARPQVAAVVLTATVAASAIAATALLTLVALVLIFDPHSNAWCERFLGHGSHRALVPGLVLGAAALFLLARGTRSLLQHRRMLTGRRPTGAADVEIVNSPQVIAYAHPGRPGHVVVSQAMLDALSGEEQLVLFAHERAHLRHGHHRYIALSEACAAAIPMLHPLASSVRFACERWADEEAASVVGERKLVARAVAVAALAQADAPALSFGGSSGVPARVEAMLERPSSRGGMPAFVVVGAALAAIGAAALQTQRLGEVLQLVL